MLWGWGNCWQASASKQVSGSWAILSWHGDSLLAGSKLAGCKQAQISLHAFANNANMLIALMGVKKRLSHLNLIKVKDRNGESLYCAVNSFILSHKSNSNSAC